MTGIGRGGGVRPLPCGLRPSRAEGLRDPKPVPLELKTLRGPTALTETLKTPDWSTGPLGDLSLPFAKSNVRACLLGPL